MLRWDDRISHEIQEKKIAVEAEETFSILEQNHNFYTHMRMKMKSSSENQKKNEMERRWEFLPDVRRLFEKKIKLVVLLCPLNTQ